jgi:hypothetical protein
METSGRRAPRNNRRRWASQSTIAVLHANGSRLLVAEQGEVVDVAEIVAAAEFVLHELVDRASFDLHNPHARGCRVPALPRNEIELSDHDVGSNRRANLRRARFSICS